ncbi:LysE family transporter [Desulfitobacterium sp.]|uniref:LysE family transporter n=1 Tax=Desulfitobacterium sp. TaxID=49981 RepID=UPI002BE3FF85|nr:LysE family transporter [Desulfitobacterium sp.]HVJ48954.1 LysE family transporter [Desulfitobacterium sp.]
MLEIFLMSLIMGFSGAIMPGPLLTVTINESLHRGAKAGPLIVLGHAILELVLVLAIFFGLGSALTTPGVKGTIGLVGGGFLIWMAYGILKEALNQASLNLNGNSQVQRLNPIIAGITVSASNPYWSLWWATAGAGSLLLSAKAGVFGALSFYLGHILSDFLWYTGVSCAIAKSKTFFTARVYQVVLGFCGLFLIGLAGYFIYSGIRFWFGPVA